MDTPNANTSTGLEAFRMSADTTLNHICRPPTPTTYYEISNDDPDYRRRSRDRRRSPYVHDVHLHGRGGTLLRNLTIIAWLMQSDRYQRSRHRAHKHRSLVVGVEGGVFGSPLRFWQPVSPHFHFGLRNGVLLTH
ncbi:hypothetical protein KC19_VG316800 [Ceratodon purpureus]|uniref:Uncharacterized protein n=1 Tax=Ceratodon purpureus TaxID=3225 RepID=A0A8T0HVM8_CERPU|nr:hypothetical protein KC19_VG316800 [Ceratodon purpureus]